MTHTTFRSTFRTLFRKTGGALLLLAVGIACGVWMSERPAVVAAQDTGEGGQVSTSDWAAQAKPVEKSVHEYMEHVHEPIIKRLKTLMANPPGDNEKAWSAIKHAALVFAESGNLLLLRGPQEDRALWVKCAVGLREAAAKFYRDAKEQDYTAALKSFKGMAHSCGQCHGHFKK